MRWLFARQLRPFVTLAAGASLLLNLALLAPALYMLQVFDRVFASGSVETLVMLSIAAMVSLSDVPRMSAMPYSVTMISRSARGTVVLA